VTELRDYQVRALEQTREVYRAGKRRIVVVMPTGAGKTRLGAEYVRGHVERGGRVLWLATASSSLRRQPIGYAPKASVKSA
jgi:superfamily II DNA or RNA helicase